MEARSRNFHTGIRGIKLHAQLASQVAGCELVDGSKLVEGSRLVEGFNDGSKDGNELVEGSIDDDGTWLVEGGSNDGFNDGTEQLPLVPMMPAW